MNATQKQMNDIEAKLDRVLYTMLAANAAGFSRADFVDFDSVAEGERVKGLPAYSSVKPKAVPCVPPILDQWHVITAMVKTGRAGTTESRKFIPWAMKQAAMRGEPYNPAYKDAIEKTYLRITL